MADTRQDRSDALRVRYLSVGMANTVHVVDTPLEQDPKELQQDTDSC